MLGRFRDRGYKERLFADLRSAGEMGLAAPFRFAKERASAAYQGIYDKREPLVSVCIPTYNRSRLLVERSIASVLDQTYRNLEIIVVGDHCTDDTPQRVGAIGDDRIVFTNLEERGKYPEDPQLRYFVAGCVPFNHALRHARGDFITHLDDDDAYVPERVETLVRHAQATRADVIFHPFAAESSEGGWTVNEAREFLWGYVTTSSVFYHRWFRAIEGDLHAYRRLEPGDWCRFRKMRYLRARISRHPDILTRHFREQNNVDTKPV